MPLLPSIKQLAPSLEFKGRDTVTMSIADLRRLVALVLANVAVDERWYFAQYPDVAEDAKGSSSNNFAATHFRNFGYLEDRLPVDPEVDEEWYKSAYPDIAAAIQAGMHPSASAHFIEHGYAEGRRPNAAAPDPTLVAELPGTDIKLGQPSPVKPSGAAPSSSSAGPGPRPGIGPAAAPAWAASIGRAARKITP